MKNHILIVDQDAEVYADALSNARLDVNCTAVTRAEDAVAAQSSATILVALDPVVRPGLVAKAENLRFVQALTTGTDSVQRALAERSDVVVASVKGIHGEAMSEFALLQMLTLQKGYLRFLTQQAERQWTRHRHGTLAGKTVGILGVGQIASSLAKRLRAFDMRVIGFSSSDGRHDPTFDVLLNRVDLLATAPQLDFLVVLVPFSPTTKRIVNAEVLGAMKPSAFVINLARGGVLDESALALCLHEGRIAGAALDVFAHEPLPPDSELWDCPNLLITPHVGANCDDYAERASPIVVENVRRFLDGADARSLLNYVRG